GDRLEVWRIACGLVGSGGISRERDLQRREEEDSSRRERRVGGTIPLVFDRIVDDRGVAMSRVLARDPGCAALGELPLLERVTPRIRLGAGVRPVADDVAFDVDGAVVALCERATDGTLSGPGNPGDEPDRAE